MKIKDFDAVLLDLDGTLIDSAPDISMALNHALAQCGFATFDIELTRSWIGNGVDKLLERALVAANSNDLNVSTQQVKRAFFESYAKLNGQYSRVYPGVRDALTYCQQHGIKLACVTNKPSAFSAPLLADKQLLEFFPVLISGDDVEHKKPNPEMLYDAARQLAVNPGACLVVGDSENDVLAAQSANMKICAVSYGYDQGVDLTTLGIDAKIDSITNLID